MGVSTICRAYGELRRAGVIYPPHRKGTFAGSGSDAAPGEVELDAPFFSVEPADILSKW